MEFEEDEALVAADNCEDVYSATKFLHQECELCASRMNVKEVIAFSNNNFYFEHRNWHGHSNVMKVRNEIKINKI